MRTIPKFKDLREERGLQAKQVAERAGVDVTMYSRFEDYRALPIPAEFERIIEALNCTPNEVYSPDEVRLLPNANRVEATGGTRATTEPTEYKMTVRLGNDSRQVLTREVLQKCGYKSINEWVAVCVQRLKKQYDAIVNAEKKPRETLRNKERGAVGARQSTNTPTDAILPKSKTFVK